MNFKEENSKDANVCKEPIAGKRECQAQVVFSDKNSTFSFDEEKENIPYEYSEDLENNSGLVNSKKRDKDESILSISFDIKIKRSPSLNFVIRNHDPVIQRILKKSYSLFSFIPVNENSIVSLKSTLLEKIKGKYNMFEKYVSGKMRRLNYAINLPVNPYLIKKNFMVSIIEKNPYLTLDNSLCNDNQEISKDFMEIVELKKNHHLARSQSLVEKIQTREIKSVKKCSNFAACNGLGNNNKYQGYSKHLSTQYCPLNTKPVTSHQKNSDVAKKIIAKKEKRLNSTRKRTNLTLLYKKFEVKRNGLSESTKKKRSQISHFSDKTNADKFKIKVTLSDSTKIIPFSSSPEQFHLEMIPYQTKLDENSKQICMKMIPYRKNTEQFCSEIIPYRSQINRGFKKICKDMILSSETTEQSCMTMKSFRSEIKEQSCIIVPFKINVNGLQNVLEHKFGSQTSSMQEIGQHDMFSNVFIKNHHPSDSIYEKITIEMNKNSNSKVSTLNKFMSCGSDRLVLNNILKSIDALIKEKIKLIQENTVQKKRIENYEKTLIKYMDQVEINILKEKKSSQRISELNLEIENSKREENTNAEQRIDFLNSLKQKDLYNGQLCEQIAQLGLKIEKSLEKQTEIEHEKINMGLICEKTNKKLLTQTEILKDKCELLEKIQSENEKAKKQHQIYLKQENKQINEIGQLKEQIIKNTIQKEKKIAELTNQIEKIKKQAQLKLDDTSKVHEQELRELLNNNQLLNAQIRKNAESLTNAIETSEKLTKKSKEQKTICEQEIKQLKEQINFIRTNSKNQLDIEHRQYLKHMETNQIDQHKINELTKEQLKNASEKNQTDARLLASQDEKIAKLQISLEEKTKMEKKLNIHICTIKSEYQSQLKEKENQIVQNFNNQLEEFERERKLIQKNNSKEVAEINHKNNELKTKHMDEVRKLKDQIIQLQAKQIIVSNENEIERKTAKVIQLTSFTKKCTFPGCNGNGNIYKGKNHKSLNKCPLFLRKALEIEKKLERINKFPDSKDKFKKKIENLQKNLYKTESLNKELIEEIQKHIDNKKFIEQVNSNNDLAKNFQIQSMLVKIEQQEKALNHLQNKEQFSARLNSTIPSAINKTQSDSSILISHSNDKYNYLSNYSKFIEAGIVLEENEVPEKCSLCNLWLKNKRGLSIHNGKMHK